MELRTDRLVLRPIAPTDVHDVFRGLSHPDVVRHYGVHCPTLEATREQMDWYATIAREGTGAWWAVRSAADDTFLGAIGLNNIMASHRRGELGFWLMPAHWRKGYIAEALPAVIDHAFNSLGLHRLMAEVETGNTASANVLRRAGFTQEGTLRECEVKAGGYLSLDVFALLDK
ncbi:MAG: GNAT family N-acetyltransferase [Flavobacteriales bacterium]|jgi:ribosomal-protein-alanine N-acetyltransferase|nr:GNAT family N-acetyltransferase [Flavobacteriales bacterium]